MGGDDLCVWWCVAFRVLGVAIPYVCDPRPLPLPVEHQTTIRSSLTFSASLSASLSASIHFIHPPLRPCSLPHTHTHTHTHTPFPLSGTAGPTMSPSGTPTWY
jgi:hypothetical protein